MYHPCNPEAFHDPDDAAVTARLLIGPVLRRVVGTRATVWMETTAPATVRVTAAGGAEGHACTFTVYGHHYALVVIENLAPDTAHPYEVFLDELRVWPAAQSAYPPSVIRTRADGDRDVRLIFGSCRQTTQHSRGRRLPPDALDAYCRRLAAEPDNPAHRPDLLLLLGDQVYADEPSPVIKRYLRRGRRKGPGDQVVTFDEYTRLYLESWRDPEIRWLLSTVPTAMIFDDHEIIDDWNTSLAWRHDMSAQPWWAERITAGIASYWVYQHLGNLTPDEIAADPVYAKVRDADDATEALHEFAAAVDLDSDTGDDPRRWQRRGYRWSYALDIADTRLVVLDNRCTRVLESAHRAMLPAEEWNWFLDQAHGAYEHLVVGSSLPWLMPPAIHHVEAWNEELAGSGTPRVAALSERMRRAFDMEHWAAFRRSFDALGELFRRLANGSVGEGRIGAGAAYAAPASISVLSGDVHHSYVARALLGPDATSPVHQITCSPIYNQVPAPMRPLMRLGWARGPAMAMRVLARSVGVPRPMVRWRKIAGPYFGNAISTLEHRGRTAHVRVEGTTKDGRLRTVAELPLT